MHAADVYPRRSRWTNRHELRMADAEPDSGDAAHLLDICQSRQNGQGQGWRRRLHHNLRFRVERGSKERRDRPYDGWEQLYVNYTPETSGTYLMVLCQRNCGKSQIAFDDVQLETGMVASSYNLAAERRYDI